MIGLRLGAFLFSLQKKQQAVTQTKTIDSYVLVSNQEPLRVLLTEKLKAPVVRVEKLNILEIQPQQEIIFDADYISNKNTIAKMKLLGLKGLTCKIKPQSANYILGSNHSNDRGTVISWSE